MKIHGAVYVVLGILMSLYARFIQVKTQKSSMALFFWLGIGFIIFGIFRLITNYVFKDNSKVKSREPSGLEKLKRERENFLNKASGSSALQQSIVACSRCGTKHYSNSNFCHICGASLK